MKIEKLPLKHKKPKWKMCPDNVQRLLGDMAKSICFLIEWRERRWDAWELEAVGLDWLATGLYGSTMKNHEAPQ